MKATGFDDVFGRLAPLLPCGRHRLHCYASIRAPPVSTRRRASNLLRAARGYYHASQGTQAVLNSNALTQRMERRLTSWAAIGTSATYAGRNLVLKNSVLAMAWYTIESQTIPDINICLSRW